MANCAICEITVDKDLQPREYITDSIVDEYAEAMKQGMKFPPVIIFNDGKSKLLADGFHRYYAAKKAGFQNISAEFRTGTKEDALRFSLSANSTHGLRRSQRDKRHAVMTALEHLGNLSNREIGRLVQVDDKTIGKYRERMAVVADIVARIDAGESFEAKHGDDRLFIFRLPDDTDRPDLHYVKLLYYSPNFVAWDERGVNTLALKCAVYCVTSDKHLNRDGKRLDWERFRAANHVDMIEFDEWKSLPGGSLEEILKIAKGKDGRR